MQQSDTAHLDKASLGKVFDDAGFPLHFIHWGGVKVYAIYSPEKVDAQDQATVGVVIRTMLDKVLLGLHNGAADIGVSAESTSAADKPMEGMEGCMLSSILPCRCMPLTLGSSPAPYVGCF